MAQDSNKLSRPPQFGQLNDPNSTSPGPQTQREWADFYRWLYSQYQAVTTLQGQSLPPNAFPAPFGGHSGDAGEVLALLAGHQVHTPTGGGQMPPVLSYPPSNQRSQAPTGGGFPSPPYATRRPIEIIVCTQATFPTLTGQVPVFVFVTDYVHMIYWNGTAFSFAGDQSGCISLWESDPGTGYHLCDGATVSRLNADGTVTSVSLPDLTSSAAAAAYLKAGTPNGGPNAATAPTFTGTPATPTGTVSSSFAGDTINFSTTDFVSVAGTDAALVSPTSITPTGAVSSTFTGASATPAGTISATGQPRNLVRRPFYRL